MDINKNYYKIFPYLRDKKKLLRLKIDEESISFISHKDVANKISSIIISYLKEIKIQVEDVYITDATAGVGGNAISFCLTFGFCNGIEFDQKRCDYLRNNLDVYEVKNYDVHCGDCTKEMMKIKKQDIIFIDPPWGGKNYKKYKNLRLCLGEISIEDLIYDLFNSKNYISNPKIVVLKLPLNYDITHFFNSLKDNTIYIHKLKKMYILVVIKKLVQNNKCELRTIEIKNTSKIEILDE
uniref:Trimethylguanosine synthase n=1 Tax=viral metagenome TaxID=1070528 RepID=A0A6C0ACH9_9ZZZZ